MRAQRGPSSPSSPLRRGPDGAVESEFGGVSGLRQPTAWGARETPADVAREAREVDAMDTDWLPEGGTGVRVK